MASLRTSLLCIAYAAFTNAQAAITLTAPPAAATDGTASQIISPSFAGMGIEPSNLFSFTGQEDVNELSMNLLENLAGYTGAPPHLRIGGNTADYMIWDPSFSGYYLRTNKNAVGQGSIPSDHFIFGPAYFTAMNRLPRNTPITFGLNLAYQDADYLDRICDSASAALNASTNINLFSFEIGNEPDLYLQNGFRNGTWDNFVYGQQWTDRANAVYDRVLKPAGVSPNFFEGACTASTIGTSFEIVQLLKTPMVAAVNGTDNTMSTFLSGWNQHDYFYYIDVSGYQLTLDYFMDLSQTPNQFAAWVDQQAQAAATGKPYYLREMASVGPVGLTGISDVFGATLWTFNFFLYTASLNITNVNMHMTDNSFAAPWQPVNNYNMGPYVRTTYYAWAAMDQIIGSGCSTRVAPLTVTAPSATYANRLGAYASYKNDRLAAVVILNTLVANASETAKGSANVTLSLPNYANQTLYLSYLTADGADSRYNTTWNGLSYEQSGNGLPTIVDQTVPNVTIAADGSVTFSVRDSQAVVANIGYQIGTSGTPQYAANACSALVSFEVAQASALPTGAPSYAVSTTSIPPVTTQVGADANGATESAASATQKAISSTSSGEAGPMKTAMPAMALLALGGAMVVLG